MRATDGRVVRARAQVAGALAVARAGRLASAERILRGALGVFERRQRYAGAARAAATLGLVLRERGQLSRAADELRRAHMLLDAVSEEGRPEDEAKDFTVARSLLGATPTLGVPSSGPEPRDGATVAAFAAEVCRLLLAGEEIDDTGALPRICAWLRSRLGARSVAVYLSGRTRVPVAVSGPAERFDAVVVPASSSAHCISLIRLGRGQGYGVATDIGGKDEPVGTLLARWASVPAATELPWFAGLLRAAAVVCYPDLRLAAVQALEVEMARADGLLGESTEMHALRAAISRVASAPYPVLIEAESGVGKELVARALHRTGPRRAGHFCAINCAALTDELFEAGLFGHVRGGFTRRRDG